MADKFVDDPHKAVKIGDIVKVKVMKIDIQRKRIALTMRLNEQPGDTSARRGASNGDDNKNCQANRNNLPGKHTTKNKIDNSTTGNSAMSDALALALGKLCVP